MKKNTEQNSEYIRKSSNQPTKEPTKNITKETNPEVTSITPVSKKDLLEDFTDQSIEKTVSVNLEEPKTVLAQKKTPTKIMCKPSKSMFNM